MDKPTRINSDDDATRRVQGTDRTYTAEEIARHVLDNPLRVYNVTIQQVEQLARAYLDELRDKAPQKPNAKAMAKVIGDWLARRA